MGNEKNIPAFKELPDLLTVQELSDYLRCSTKVTYAMLKSGKIAYIRVGRHQYRIPKQSLDNFVGS